MVIGGPTNFQKYCSYIISKSILWLVSAELAHLLWSVTSLWPVIKCCLIRWTCPSLTLQTCGAVITGQKRCTFWKCPHCVNLENLFWPSVCSKKNANTHRYTFTYSKITGLCHCFACLDSCVIEFGDAATSSLCAGSPHYRSLICICSGYCFGIVNKICGQCQYKNSVFFIHNMTFATLAKVIHDLYCLVFHYLHRWIFAQNVWSFLPVTDF